MNRERIRKLNSHEYKKGPVLYWMNRDIRVQDNWALLFADHVARKTESTLMVAYNLDPIFLHGGRRQVEVKLAALEEIEKDLRAFGVPFFVVLEEERGSVMKGFCTQQKVGVLITDFSPLRKQRAWMEDLSGELSIPFYEVDAHNIVPVWIASPKQEFGAYTLRPKLHKLLPTYLDDFPNLDPRKSSPLPSAIDWKHLRAQIKTNESIETVPFLSGEKAAHGTLRTFLSEKLPTYHLLRNDPNEDVLSELSPYLHYGMISAQRIALETTLIPDHEEAKAAFLEELIVRRELADNFCFYNSQYDNPKGYPAWAQKSLEKHKNDPREYLYDLEHFEKAATHDPLWNAAQKQLLLTGKMHGYMRMYWAKKILEWTKNVETAHQIAVTLNDRYELDGRDPNGYVGVSWALGGLHDRAWVERPIFGQIRYMNFNGCKRKFDVDAYVRKWL